MSTPNFGIAFLHSTLVQEDGWRQVLPAGHFRAVDGRPTEPTLKKGWFINKEIAERLINQVKAKGKIALDYEHAYLHALQKAEKGETPEPVIASGWIHESDIKWHEKDGLLIKPRWTKKAKAHIDEGELADLSALFTYDKNTGEPLNFLNVALTNDPALTLKGLTNYAALNKLAALSLNPQSTTGDNSMNEYLLKLLAALGLEATEENIAEVTDTAVEKINSLITKEASSEDTIADLKAKQVDPLKYVPREALNEAQATIAALSKTSNATQVDALIAQGRKTGKVMKSEVENLKQIAKTHGLAVLKATINSRVAIAGLSDESQITDAAVDAVKSELTEEEKEAARLLGIDEAEYLKILLEQEGA
ncbi:phage protease [Ignatzschineria cameli]|uniref:Protease (I) and scaffold (Z) protein n=1 Tax=Ignatzschineria cameli TaxID=2182793 RepID=A0ABX5L0Q8_9GAMM|nr:phage protease [Ignatzschineria cameli]PWD90349.1 hypothetical protein DC079_04200 [Ignatzschineria cameli]PWD92232.1 hypothetical protein DC081_03905 [Ignatzschineria cameli]PWD93026.1 hypothetical protein DC078_04200 [Ignatzschineria cameli]